MIEDQLVKELFSNLKENSKKNYAAWMFSLGHKIIGNFKQKPLQKKEVGNIDLFLAILLSPLSLAIA